MGQSEVVLRIQALCDQGINMVNIQGAALKHEIDSPIADEALSALQVVQPLLKVFTLFRRQ
jgi:hypothetical protein